MILYVVHNTSHAYKSKTRHILAFYGDYALGLVLLKGKGRICEASRGCTPSSTAMASCDDEPTCDDMHILFN
jgi:hypothetical protein